MIPGVSLLQRRSLLVFAGILTAIASTPSAFGLPNLWVFNFHSELLSLISSALLSLLYFLCRSWLFVEERVHRGPSRLLSVPSVAPAWRLKQTGGWILCVAGNPNTWHMSFPVQGVLGIRVPWTLELLSPIFLLTSQSLLTGEIMWMA